MYTWAFTVCLQMLRNSILKLSALAQLSPRMRLTSIHSQSPLAWVSTNCSDVGSRADVSIRAVEISVKTTVVFMRFYLPCRQIRWLFPGPTGISSKSVTGNWEVEYTTKGQISLTPDYYGIILRGITDLLFEKGPRSDIPKLRYPETVLTSVTYPVLLGFHS